MFEGLQRRRERNEQLLAGLLEAEARRAPQEARLLEELEKRITVIEEDFAKLKKEEKGVVKLRKLLHKAHSKKIAILKKDFRLRRRMKIDESGRHAHGNERKERRFARKRRKLLMKQQRNLEELANELRELEHHTSQLHEDEKAAFESYQSFVQEVREETLQVSRSTKGFLGRLFG